MNLPEIWIGNTRRWHHFFVPAWDPSWVNSGYSSDQNDSDSPGTYVTCINCGPRVGIIMHEKLHGARDYTTCMFLKIMDTFSWFCFLMCRWQGPNTPVGDVANWKRHQRLDEILIFFYPHYIRQISKVVFRKTLSCNTLAKLNAILFAQHTLSIMPAFHTA